MEMSNIKKGNFLKFKKINFDKYVYVYVLDVKKEKNEIAVEGKEGSNILIDMNNSNKLISPISISEVILLKLGYTKEEKPIYGLPTTSVYSLKCKNNNNPNAIIQDKDKSWCLVLPSPKSFFGCELKPIINLEDLQETLLQLYTYKKIIELVNQ